MILIIFRYFKKTRYVTDVIFELRLPLDCIASEIKIRCIGNIFLYKYKPGTFRFPCLIGYWMQRII